jgi:hypothetical protein
VLAVKKRVACIGGQPQFLSPMAYIYTASSLVSAACRARWLGSRCIECSIPHLKRYLSCTEMLKWQTLSPDLPGNLVHLPAYQRPMQTSTGTIRIPIISQTAGGP